MTAPKLTTAQALAQDRLGEDLVEWIKDARRGHSGISYVNPWRWVAEDLNERTGLTLTAETVRQWAKGWGIE